jgi:hypothetical protein
MRYVRLLCRVDALLMAFMVDMIVRRNRDALRDIRRVELSFGRYIGVSCGWSLRRGVWHFLQLVLPALGRRGGMHITQRVALIRLCIMDGRGICRCPCWRYVEDRS